MPETILNPVPAPGGITQYHTVEGRLLGETGDNGRYDYLTDGVGSVTMTLKEETVSVARRWRPYGSLLTRSGSGDGSTDPAFGWTGETGSLATGLLHAEQHNRARHYASALGNWTTRDPLWPSESAYSYVDGQPLNYVDPSGRQKLALEYKAFIHREQGLWHHEPAPNPIDVLALERYEYRGDNRGFGEKGKSRISTRIEVDSCKIGTDARIVNNTGLSTRRRWFPSYGKPVDKPSTSLQNTATPLSVSIIGGPCKSYFHSVVRSAYPFNAPIAPTQIAIKGFFEVTGRKKVRAELGISHSLFPNFELLFKQGGEQKIVYSYPTDTVNAGLIFPIDVIVYFVGLIDAPTASCCTDKPCCEGECRD